MPFDRLDVYSNFDYWLKETIFELRLSTRGNSCYFTNWYCVDLCAVLCYIRSGLLPPVPGLWRGYECSRLFFVLAPIMLLYYLNPLTSPSSGIVFFELQSPISERPILFLFSLSVPAGGPDPFSTAFTAFEDIAAWTVLHPLAEDVHNTS